VQGRTTDSRAGAAVTHRGTPFGGRRDKQRAVPARGNNASECTPDHQSTAYRHRTEQAHLFLAKIHPALPPADMSPALGQVSPVAFDPTGWIPAAEVRREKGGDRSEIEAGDATGARHREPGNEPLFMPNRLFSWSVRNRCATSC